MSDAAQNVEIEDVLASIRRLVSDEVSQELARMAPLPRGESGRSVEDEAGPQDDTPPALVLTPALRVHTGGLGTPVEPAVSGEAPSEVAEPSEPYVLTQASLTDATPTAQDNESAAHQDAAHLTAEDPAEADTTDTDHEALPEAVAAHVAKAADAANRAAAEYIDDAQDTQDEEYEDEAQLSTSHEAELEAAPAENDVPQDYAEDTEEPATAAEEISGAAHDDAEAAGVHDQDEPESQTLIVEEHIEEHNDAELAPEDESVAEYSAPEPHKAEATSLEAKIAKLESMIGARDESWESETFETITPETHIIEDIVDTPLEWEDASVELAFASEQADLQDAGHATGHFETEPQPVAETASLEEGGEVFESQDLLIDEDMLRDVVSSIVREELKGALGERITRNVRKLVRREIHRALANHDLK